ncbi:MAG: hypothetical protein OH338_04800 [Candidatus Parvarchaeota archaeon]|nr:hypothetical protein [Candidatus Parvarchaeum tengchongense]MCW1312716.1 hypothetical protein [Candidatus Parvarchaeum tengchongense]
MIFGRKNKNKPKKLKDKSNLDNPEKISKETKDFENYKDNSILKGISLKTAEAQQDDIGQNSVRISSAWMKQLGVKPGDFVEIEGNRKTVSKVDRVHPGDLGLNIIRMDGTIRKNAKAAIGENVIVRKAEVYEADVVNFSPLSTISIRGAENVIGRLLLDRAVSKGDIITLGSGGRSSFGSFFGDDMMSIFENTAFPSFQFGFSELRFLVTSTSPKGFVVITENTDVNVSRDIINLATEVDGTTEIPFYLGITNKQKEIIWLIDHYDRFPIEKSRIIETTEDYQDNIEFDLILYKDNKKYILKHFIFSVIPASAGRSRIKIDVSVNRYGAVKLSVHNPPSTEAVEIYFMEEIIKSPSTQAKNILKTIESILSTKGLNLTTTEKDQIKKIQTKLTTVLKSSDEEELKRELKESLEVLDKIAEKIYYVDQK